MRRMEPTAIVIAFILIGTLAIWVSILAVGPGRPGDAVALGVAGAPIAVALGLGWVLSRTAAE